MNKHDLIHIKLPLFGESNLYLGPEYQLKNAIFDKGVKCVINVGNVPYTNEIRDDFKFINRENAEEQEIDGIKFLFCPVDDGVDKDLRQFFPKINQFIREAINRGGNVSIHSQKGISRAAVALSAFVIEEAKYSAEVATSLVRANRSCVAPNIGFHLQLSIFERFLKPKTTVQIR
ncbi:dual specificity protein phosphatase family protein [Piscirickettsia salmonis]|uniref:dual specificity protein phosphatase family protein n=1 Tax=Piscirickettsia salmonis TaxID=1238 RepID=UPI0007C8A51B|nr:Dual specificity phosphatase, catalytic domain [Piscirickettsiaceae bacterium NZ-RLO1]